MSNISTGQARQASMQIAQQERANQQRSIAESSRLDQLERTGQSRVDIAKMQGQSQVDIAKMEGEAMRQKQEQARIGAMYGLGIDRMGAADTARQTARSAGLAGLGQAAGGVAGLFAAGGSLYGTDPFKPQGNYENEYQMGTTYDPNKDEFGNTIG